MLMHQIIKKSKDKICLIYKEKKITYAELDEQTDFLAYRLDIKKQDKVGINFVDPVQQLIYFFAIIKASGIGIFMPENFTSLEHFDCVLGDEFLVSEKSTFWQKQQNFNEDLFLGVFSSGSTGEPKLILRDDKSWMSAFDYQSELFNVSENSIVYLVANLSYSANLNALLHAFYVGATVVLTGGKNISLWLDEINKYNVNSLFMVPAYYQMFLKKSKNKNLNMQSIVSGGAKMDLTLATNLKENFPNANICQYYGAGETGHISYALYDDMLKKPHSVGKLFPKVSAKFIDSCIFVKSPYLAHSYQPMTTAGDLGYLDNDGYLFLTGRKQEIINIAGIKIALPKIEQVLNDCKKVEKAVVVSIADSIRGEIACAFIVKKQDDLSKAELLKHCKKSLNANVCPQKIVFLDKIPLNDNGKIDKMKLKTMVQ